MERFKVGDQAVFVDCDGRRYNVHIIEECMEFDGIVEYKIDDDDNRWFLYGMWVSEEYLEEVK